MMGKVQGKAASGASECHLCVRHDHPRAHVSEELKSSHECPRVFPQDAGQQKWGAGRDCSMVRRKSKEGILRFPSLAFKR